MRTEIQIRLDESAKRRLKASLAVRGITINDFVLEGINLACEKHGIKKVTGGKL